MHGVFSGDMFDTHVIEIEQLIMVLIQKKSLILGAFFKLTGVNILLYYMLGIYVHV